MYRDVTTADREIPRRDSARAVMRSGRGAQKSRCGAGRIRHRPLAEPALGDGTITDEGAGAAAPHFREGLHHVIGCPKSHRDGPRRAVRNPCTMSWLLGLPTTEIPVRGRVPSWAWDRCRLGSMGRQREGVGPSRQKPRGWASQGTMASGADPGGGSQELDRTLRSP